MQTKFDASCLPDAQLLCIMNFCFYRLLRIGNVSIPNSEKWDANRILTRQDIQRTFNGFILNIRSSKTIQFRQRVFQAVIPKFPGHPHCPTAALESFLTRVGPLPGSYPALAYRRPDNALVVPHTPRVRKLLSNLFVKMGLSSKDYNTHSLRRSGATHLLSVGVPVDMIKILADWKSDCVFKYLKPSPDTKLTVAKSFSQS